MGMVVIIGYVSPFSISRLNWEQRYDSNRGGTAVGVEKGSREAIVIRSRRVTLRGTMVCGIWGSLGVG